MADKHPLTIQVTTAEREQIELVASAFGKTVEDFLVEMVLEMSRESFAVLTGNRERPRPIGEMKDMAFIRQVQTKFAEETRRNRSAGGKVGAETRRKNRHCHRGDSAKP